MDDFYDTTMSSFVEKPKKQVRSWCDICETFDQHETDDCPTQANDSEHYVVKNQQWDPNAYDDDDDETY